MIKQGNIAQINHLFTDQTPPEAIQEILSNNAITTHIT